MFLAVNKWTTYISKQMSYSEYSFVLVFPMTKPQSTYLNEAR